MASVAAGISCTGTLGGKQGFLPYPSGPSQPVLASLGHFGIIRVLYNAPCLLNYSIYCMLRYCYDINVHYVLC
jgi:hypothetical protein